MVRVMVKVKARVRVRIRVRMSVRVRVVSSAPLLRVTHLAMFWPTVPEYKCKTGKVGRQYVFILFPGLCLSVCHQ